jgi:alkanesulfonate monooxygenase
MLSFTMLPGRSANARIVLRRNEVLGRRFTLAMPVEIVGMVATRDASEIQGPLVDGPVADWTDGPVIDPGYLEAISLAHETAGFDRVLVGYGTVAPEGWAMASTVLSATSKLKVLVAHRPGVVQPLVLARHAATLDHLSGGGRVAIHFITGGDEADQHREGDFVAHDDRYRRTGETMAIVRRLMNDPAPFDYTGEFFRYEGAFISVKPTAEGAIPLYFGGASQPAIDIGTRYADVYAFWGEPLDATAARIKTIEAVARPLGRHLRYSVSIRPIIADTEEAAWEKAERFAEIAAERIHRARERLRADSAQSNGLGSVSHATYSIKRDSEMTSSVGRKRLIEMSTTQDVFDERLWMKIANLTGAAGNSTALVGTPDQVAESLLRYYDLGVTTLLLKGFDPLGDVVDYGEQLLPLIREGAQKRDEQNESATGA